MVLTQRFMPRFAGESYFGDMVRTSGARYNSHMWLIPSPNEVTMLTVCPSGHERTLTYDERTPERDWTLTCPLCGREHRLILPEIRRSDL